MRQFFRRMKAAFRRKLGSSRSQAPTVGGVTVISDDSFSEVSLRASIGDRLTGGTLTDRLRAVGASPTQFAPATPMAVPVDSQRARWLELGDHAIHTARWLTPDGAGDQVADVEHSHGVSFARWQAARSASRNAHRARDIAQSAAKHGGAAGREYAAMTFTQLAAIGVGDANLLRVRSAASGHEFTLIGDPRRVPEPVVVDAWAQDPSAMLWSDSAWSSPEAGPLEILETWKRRRPTPKLNLRQYARSLWTPRKANKACGLNPNARLLDHVVERHVDTPFLKNQARTSRGGQITRYKELKQGVIFC